MAVDTTFVRIGLTLSNAIIYYILYRIVIFFIGAAKDVTVKSMKTIFKYECTKRSIGTPCMEPTLSADSQ